MQSKEDAMFCVVMRSEKEMEQAIAADKDADIRDVDWTDRLVFPEHSCRKE